MTDVIRETAAVGGFTGSRQLATLITPGVGSSGTYTAEVLEQAAKDRVFPKGTQCHVDHDGEMARYEQPAGSLTRLAAALTEDAQWQPDWVDPETGVKGRLAAEVEVFTPWRTFLKEAAEYIGMSISAAASVKKGVVEALHPSPLNRVDYVTVAGRGGRISAVLESATRIVDETVANDVEQWLSQAVRAAHNTDNSWVYLDGHDDAFAYFRNDGRLYRQGYTLDGVNVTLNGTPVEVRRRTEYDPVTPTTEAATPAATVSLRLDAGMSQIMSEIQEHMVGGIIDQSTISKVLRDHIVVTKEDSSPIPAEVKEKAKSKETPNMAEIKIEETRLATLEESHGRVPALEAKLTATESENVSLKTDLAKAKAANRAREFATTIVKAANADLSESVVARIVAQSTTDIPLTEALQLDTDALTESVTAARLAEETYLAKLAKENGLGQVRGIGATEVTGVAEATDADILKALKGIK